MKKDHFAFGFRCERRLGDQIRQYCKGNAISFNTLIERVLLYVGKYHDEGRICLSEKSAFRCRPDRRDKETTLLILKADVREMVRNLSFSYRKSMAEVIRLGLEMYLDLMGKDESGSDRIKHIYNIPTDLVHIAIAFLYPALPANKVPYPLLI